MAGQSGEALVNVSELVNERPVGSPQIRIFILCGLVALLDGFDLQSIGLAAPPELIRGVVQRMMPGLDIGANARCCRQPCSAEPWPMA
jgi:hypothetical protein